MAVFAGLNTLGSVGQRQVVVEGETSGHKEVSIELASGLNDAEAQSLFQTVSDAIRVATGGGTAKVYYVIVIGDGRETGAVFDTPEAASRVCREYNRQGLVGRCEVHRVVRTSP